MFGTQSVAILGAVTVGAFIFACGAGNDRRFPVAFPVQVDAPNGATVRLALVHVEIRAGTSRFR